MNQESTEYMLLFRSTDWDRNLSPEEMQEILDGTMAWFARLGDEGRLKAAQPLFEEGKIVSGRGGRTISDGPFAESKEAVGGYLILRAASFEEALEVARTWPLLECGASVEVRPVAQDCPSFQRVRDRASHAGA